MNIKKLSKSILIIIAFFSFVTYATFIKGNAIVKDVSTDKPFAILYDSTYVAQSFISKSNKPYIEIYAGLREDDIKNNKIYCKRIEFNTCYYEIGDTVDLIDANGKAIGRIWNPFPKEKDFAGITDLRKNGSGLQIALDGFIDSSNIYEFAPWERQIEKINPKSLFKQTYSDLSEKMNSIKNRITYVRDDVFKIACTYDEQLPNPNTAILYAFNNDTLKAIWISVEIEVENKKKFNGKLLYYDVSIATELSKIEKAICAEFNSGIGMPNPFKNANNDCK